MKQEKNDRPPLFVDDATVLMATQGDEVAASELHTLITKIATQEVFRFYRNVDCTFIEEHVNQATCHIWERVLRGYYKYQPPGFAAFATTLAQNVFKDNIKSSRTRLEVPTDFTDGSAKRSFSDVDTAPAAVDAKSSLEQIMDEANLAEWSKVCVVLKDGYGCSMDEIAQIMHEQFDKQVSVGAIKQFLLRGRNRLRKVAAQADGEY